MLQISNTIDMCDKQPLNDQYSFKFKNAISLKKVSYSFQINHNLLRSHSIQLKCLHYHPDC